MRYIVFVKRDCPFCVKAEEALVLQNAEHEIVDLQDYQDLLEEYKRIYRWDTVPMAFVENTSDVSKLGSYELIGGSDDLINHLEREHESGR